LPGWWYFFLNLVTLEKQRSVAAAAWGLVVDAHKEISLWMRTRYQISWALSSLDDGNHAFLQKVLTIVF
jgi:hypothetical protein